jgi:DNA-binding response OmpR family regulator
VSGDDQGFDRLVRAILVETGLQVYAARAPSDVPSLVDELKPAVLLLNVAGANSERSWDLLKRLGSGPITSSLPIVICPSGDYLLNGHAVALQRAGIHVWSEPFDPAQLLIEVAAARAATKTLSGSGQREEEGRALAHP